MKQDNTTESGQYKPTERQILRECRRIRATWSPRERKKRAGEPEKVVYVVPTIKLNDLGLEDDSPSVNY